MIYLTHFHNFGQSQSKLFFMTDDERIEKVLNEMANNGNGRLSVQKFLSETVKDEDPLSYQRIDLAIVSMGFARKLSTIPSLEILPNGRDIVKSGGYIKYFEKIKLDEEEKFDSQKINAELDKVNLKLNKFYLKWRWVPFVFSALAIIISLLALIF